MFYYNITQGVNTKKPNLPQSTSNLNGSKNKGNVPLTSGNNSNNSLDVGYNPDSVPLTSEQQAAKDEIKIQNLDNTVKWKTLANEIYNFSENPKECIYDDKGRVSKEVYKTDFGTFIIVPEYDENDNLISRTHYNANELPETPAIDYGTLVEKPIWKDIIKDGKVIRQESMTPDIPNTNYTYFGDFLIKEEEIYGENIIQDDYGNEGDFGSFRVIKEYSVLSNYTGHEPKMDRKPIREVEVSNDGKYKSVTTIEGNTETSMEYWYDNGNVVRTKTIINTPNSQEIYFDNELNYSSFTDSNGYTTIIKPNWSDGKHTYLENPDGKTIREIIEKKDGGYTEIEYDPSQGLQKSPKVIKETRNHEVIYEDTRDENGNDTVTDVDNERISTYKDGVKFKVTDLNGKVTYEDTRDANGTGIITDIENDEIVTYKDRVKIKVINLDGEILYEDKRDADGTGDIIEIDEDETITDTYINGLRTYSTVQGEDYKEEVEYKDGKCYHSTTTYLGNSSLAKIEVEYNEGLPVKEIRFARDGSQEIIVHNYDPSMESDNP